MTAQRPGMRRGYTKFWHRATAGSTNPAMCGKKPPRGRPWKYAPPGLPECPKCAALVAHPTEMWLAS